MDIENTLSGNSTMWKRLRFHFPGFWTLTCFPLRAKWYSQKTCWQLMFLEKTKSDIQWKRTGFEFFCDFCLFNIYLKSMASVFPTNFAEVGSHIFLLLVDSLLMWATYWNVSWWFQEMGTQTLEYESMICRGGPPIYVLWMCKITIILIGIHALITYADFSAK